MAGMIQRYFTDLSRNTFLLAAASLFADISTEMLYPVLPVFLTQTLKGTAGDGGCEVEDRHKPAAVPQDLLEVSSGDGALWARQLQ